jgi:hypothetical protein
MTAAARVLLMQLSERTSARGNRYLAGWLGKASVVAFQDEQPDKRGNPCWSVFVSTPEPREEAKPAAGPDRAANRPAAASACPLGRSQGWDGSRPTAGRARTPPRLLRPATRRSTTASTTSASADTACGRARRPPTPDRLRRAGPARRHQVRAPASTSCCCPTRCSRRWRTPARPRPVPRSPRCAPPFSTPGSGSPTIR